MDFHFNTLEPDGLNSKRVQIINISLFQQGVLIKCNYPNLESKNEIIEDFHSLKKQKREKSLYNNVSLNFFRRTFHKIKKYV